MARYVMMLFICSEKDCDKREEKFVKMTAHWDGADFSQYDLPEGWETTTDLDHHVKDNKRDQTFCPAHVYRR